MAENNEPVEENEIEVVNKRNENANLNNLLMINSLYYIVVMVVIGLPIWYLTTATYRAALPFAQIDQLSSIDSFSAAVHIELVMLDGSEKKSSFDQIASQFRKKFNKGEKIALDLKVNVRLASKEETELFTRFKNIQELDESIAGKNINQMKIFVLDDESAAKFGLTKANDYVFLNNLFVAQEEIDYGKLVGFLRSEYLHEAMLKRSFDSKLNILRKLPEKSDLRVVNFDNEYEITFSLINELPERFKTWNIDFCIGKYFQKIIDQLSVYTNFKLKAQTLLYSEFNSYQLTAVANTDSADQFYYLKTSDLSIMTNYMEGRLGARVSDSAALEFVTYLSSKQPLYIVSNVNNPNESKSSSFLVPRWGGVYIYNSQNEHDDSVVADEAVKTFLFQFIDLIGIKLNPNRQRIPRSRVYDSELFGYLLKKTLENQLNSINTLKSLSSLLTRISNMVIEDKIADKVQQSVDSLEKSRECLERGDLVNAFQASKTAFVSSEAAFFDKSLLEKLYFPEDQRYAIYIPLFIPVAIPIILSALTVVKKKFKKE